MGVEMIKDANGKNQMVFNKDHSKEDELMGDKVDDFEILQVLGEGSFGFVAKAKSRLNHKIYAIKQINFSSLKGEKVIELCKNEVEILKNLNHPSITKYYKSIKEGDCLYIIMEFMNNGDLGGLIKAHKILNKPINEEKVWNIFIQAMKSLVFIHSKNLIHRDIKPENLFISNDGTLKIGDFGVSASIINKKNNQNNQNIEKIKQELVSNLMCQGTCVGTPAFMSPEMLKKTEYNLNTDVYSMGCAFFETLFWIFPRTPVMDIAALFGGQDIMKLVDIPIKNNENYYSKELVDIIYKMIERDKNKRPNSQEILDMLIQGFNKKYAQNSSIGAILCSLYAYKELTEYLTEPNNKQIISNNNINKPISFSYLFGIDVINRLIKEDWNISLYRIRSILIKENNIYDGNKEIEPRFILSFFIGKIHQELNQCKNSYKNPFESAFSGEKNENEQTSNIDLTNKNQSANIFISHFNKNNFSIISKNFYGIMKTKTVCSKCQLITYTFNSFYLVTFNLNLVKNKVNQNSQTSIFDCFFIQNSTLLNLGINKLINCRNCKKVRPHLQRKQFYSLPHFLIVCLDRGIDCQNKMKISYGLDLNLSGNYEYNNSPKIYKLIGIIKRMDKGEKEHYISIYFDYKTNLWVYRDDSNIMNINSPFDHQQGIEVIFFYTENKNNNNFNNINMNLTNQMNNISINNGFQCLNSNMNNNMNNNIYNGFIGGNSFMNNGQMPMMNSYNHQNSAQNFMVNNNYNMNLNNGNMINKSGTFS